ncbi:MAG: hypothetical protein P1V20_21315 [Verrucomicrobiales bacterium]|nr:hypothetical protein [Verrucomicrobiales bacterium]
MKTTLFILLLSLGWKQGTCETSRYGPLSVSAIFVDSESRSPLAGADVTVGGDWIFPIESRKQPSFRTDKKGKVQLPEKALKAGVAIQNQTGIGLIPKDKFAVDGGAPIQVHMHPPARLEGLLHDSEGNPLRGIPLEIARVCNSAIDGFDGVIVHHKALTKTAEDGTFRFDFLLPKTIGSGEPVPYRFSEVVYFAGDIEPESTRESLSVVRRRLDLLPGKTAFLELEGLPRSRTTVRGRILMADGSPASHSSIVEAFGNLAVLSLSPSRRKNSSLFGLGYASGGAGIQLDEKGRFETRVPVAGDWELGGFLNGKIQFSGKKEFVPVPVSGLQEITDLGDIYLSRAGGKTEK